MQNCLKTSTPLEAVAKFLWVGVLLLGVAGCAAPSTRERALGAAHQTEKLSAAELNVQLGQGYLQQDRLELALEKLRKALALDPKLPSAHTVIAVLYERINDPEAARRHYKRALELSGKVGSVLNNYGAFLCRQGDYEVADRLFEQALADPFYETPPVAHSNRGQCALNWGKLDLAEQHLRMAVQGNAPMHDALLALAQVYWKKGEGLKARAFMQRFEAVAALTAESLLLAYRIESALGNQKAAEEYKNRLLTEFSASAEAKQIQEGGGS